jgi:catalase
VEKWEASGEFIHAAYARRKDDDDWGQAGTLVRKVMDDAARGRLVSNVVGHLKKGVSAPVLARALEYWRNIDREVGDRIATGVTAQEVMSSRAVRGVGTRQKGAEPGQKRSGVTIDTFRNNRAGVKKPIR